MTATPLDVVPRLFRLKLPRDHESVERALLLAICLAIQVDQQVMPEEMADGIKLIEQFYSHTYADEEQLHGVLSAAIAKVRVDGPVKTIELLTKLLQTDADRELALKVVAFISDSDERVVPIEGALLQSLGDAFGFDNDRMTQIFNDLDDHVARTRAQAHAAQQPQTPENNPFLAYTKLPEYTACEPWQLEPAVDTLLPKLREAFKEIEDHAAPTWSQLIEPLEALGSRLGFTWGLAAHLLSVKNTDELRLAYDAVQPKLVALSTEMSQSPKIYKKLLELQESQGLDEGQRRIVEDLVRAAKLGGVGLEDLEKARFNEIQEKLASLSTRFGNNVLDGTKAFELILTAPDQVEGLERSDLQLAAQSARAAGHQDATAEAGPWRITLDFPSMGPFLKHSSRRQLRQQVYMAYITRASRGREDNTSVIDEILGLRQERAALLGYETYAEQSLSAKMADDPQSVYGLIHTLRDASWHRAKEELEQLRDFAASRGAKEELMPWDVAYWAEQLRREQYQYSSEEVRQYFPFPRVLHALFTLVEDLFGVRVAQADGQAPVWHEEVQFFNVFEDDTHIASFYLDPYSRPQEKRGGAWHNSLQGRSGPLAPQGKAFRVPISILVCNQSPPVDGAPSLMTFDEVTTLFHEFGHGLQHMLTRVDYGMASGIQNVEWDAVELPSQFMENWCYQPEVIAMMSAHVDTGEPLPEELREKIIASKNFRAASGMLRQLYFGSLDMALHDRYNPEDTSVSPFEVQKEIAAQMSPMPLLPEDRFLCSFSHIFAGGYAAGYYSYKWAEVLSADAFSAFEEAGLDDKDALAATGRRFRDTVLAMGGSKHPMHVFKDFRGREPKTDALLRHNNLV